MIRPTHAIIGPLVVSILLAFALEGPEPALANVAAPEATTTATEEPAGPEHPLAAAIVELREDTRARLDALEEVRGGALDAAAIRGVEAAIARTKLDFEIGVLELQRGQQRALGRLAATEELGRAIQALRVLRDDIEAPDVVLQDAAERTREGGQ